MTRVRNRSIRRLVSLLVVTTFIGSLAGCSTGRVWGSGGKFGAVGGGLTGLTISLAAEPESGTERTGIVLGSAVGGAVIGALVGHFLLDKKAPKAGPATTPPPAR